MAAKHTVEHFIPDGGTQLCLVASSLREGIPCHIGSYREGGFNVIVEIVFGDQVRWLARIPLPDGCYQPEEITLSYAATLDDLTGQNILVDAQFNFTGIIDFPGTVIPLPSMCVFPWFFRDNTAGLLPDRDRFLDVFLKRDAPDTSSALAAKALREKLMQGAIERQDFELGLMRSFGSLVLGRLHKYVYGEDASPLSA
ncbi:MAG: hypothetical protein M1826_002747 [Phylliscum demangeonii]|nr:MAG: hypothetical protein M1826_002747 [Phylliscum demangeonii]